MNSGSIDSRGYEPLHEINKETYEAQSKEPTRYKTEFVVHYYIHFGKEYCEVDEAIYNDSKDSLKKREIQYFSSPIIKKVESVKESEKEIQSEKEVEEADFFPFDDDLMKKLTPEEIKKFKVFIEDSTYPHSIGTFFSGLGFDKIAKKPLYTMSQYKRALDLANNYSEFHTFLSMSPKAIDLVREVPKDQTLEKWKNYVVRNPNFIGSFYAKSSKSQEAYGEMMHHSVKLGKEAIERKWEFKELLELLAKRRGFIAKELKVPDCERVGQSRGFFTAAEGKNTYTKTPYPYNTIYQRVVEKSKKEEMALSTGETYALYSEGSRGGNIQYYGNLNGEIIPLSSVSEGIFYHMDHEPDFNKVMDYVETKLYPGAIAAKSPEETYEACGRLFWWICHAKPWELGDPSIAETLFKSILASKGIESYPWQEGLVPWVEAMSEPDVNQFAKNFHTLFDKSSKT